MTKVTILGTGTWGIALARLLANKGYSVFAWSKFEQEVTNLRTNRIHPNLPGVLLPESITYCTDMQEAIAGSHIVVFAVPSVFIRETAQNASKYITDQILVDVAKGIEAGSCKTLSQVIKDEINTDKVVVLSGPTHAEEVSKDIPTMIVSASDNMECAQTVQKVFSTNVLRVYTNSDMLGVELSGAFKNIIALACGISAGLGYGDNTKAAIITRGVAELKRLGKKIGCKSSTFSGLAGIGDLVVTCTSVHSRNNQAGTLIGKGYSVKDATEKVGMVVEGINALPAAIEMCREYDIDMPIVQTVNSIVLGKITPSEAVNALMGRGLKNE